MAVYMGFRLNGLFFGVLALILSKSVSCTAWGLRRRTSNGAEDDDDSHLQSERDFLTKNARIVGRQMVSNANM
jgi:hypothetical protein